MASRYKKIKFSLVKWVVKSGMLHLFKVISRRRHIILNFHRVRPHGLPSDPFDSCPSISVELFKEILFYLKKHYEIVSVRNFCKRIDQLQPLAAITFDDGWQDNYEIAFPILQELKIPATIFMTTGKIGSSEPFWQQKLGKLFSFVVYEGEKEDQEKLRRILRVDEAEALNSDLYKKIVGQWKSRKHSEINAKLNIDGWSKKILSFERALFLSSDDLREMASRNIDFGSHTVNHVILTNECDATVESELVESKKALEEIVGKPVDMLAYPDGDFSSKIIRRAETYGYKLGCTTENVPIGKRCDPMKWPRIDFEWDHLENKDGSLNEYLFKWGIR